MAGSSATAYSQAGRVYLSGQVNTTGAVELRAGETLTVTKAIILGGGLTPFADGYHVKLVRRNSDFTSNITLVNVVSGIEGHSSDPEVKAGDVIIVPEKQKNF